MSKLTPERRAMFLAAQHCQGGHSEAGRALSEQLGVPFPIKMGDLVKKVRSEGVNPARMYGWAINAAPIVSAASRVSAPNAKRHPYFTKAEIDEVINEARTTLEAEKTGGEP